MHLRTSETEIVDVVVGVSTHGTACGKVVPFKEAAADDPDVVDCPECLPHCTPRVSVPDEPSRSHNQRPTP